MCTALSGMLSRLPTTFDASVYGGMKVFAKKAKMTQPQKKFVLEESSRMTPAALIYLADSVV